MEKLFKAQLIDTGKWVEFDSIIHCNEKCYFFKYGSGDFDSIPLSKETEIDKNTICQYTGIDDSEGNRIFEGDEVYIAGVGKVIAAITPNGVTFGGWDYQRIGKLTAHNIHDGKLTDG